MTKDKQIEEMVEVLVGGHHEMGVAWANYFCDKKFPKPQPEHIILAEALYNAGYRKASEVAEELLNMALSKIQIMITAIKAQEENGNITEFNGGAKTALEIVFRDIAELKKKYTGDRE